MTGVEVGLRGFTQARGCVQVRVGESNRRVGDEENSEAGAADRQLGRLEGS